MENFVDSAFLDRVELIFNSETKKFLIGEVNGALYLFRLLQALPMNINLSEQEKESLIANIDGNKAYSTYKELLLQHALKNQTLNIYPKNTEFPYSQKQSAYYFMGINNVDDIGSEFGIVCKDQNFDGFNFYNECTVNGYIFRGRWNEIEFPPINSLLIIDRFIFGYPYEEKLKSLTDFVRVLKKDLKINLHITVVFAMDRRGLNITPAQVDNVYEILNSLGNIEPQLIVDNKMKDHDRWIFSNYTFSNVGLPFRDINVETVFNQQFLGHGISELNIRQNYKNYIIQLKKWYKRINNIPPQIGLLRNRWENKGFTNRIFKVI